MELVGMDESYVFLGLPPSLDGTESLGHHALVFTGTVDLRAVLPQVGARKSRLAYPDQPFTWALDLTVGPIWRVIVQVAPLVYVTEVYSTGADEDDQFQFGVTGRLPHWTGVQTATGLQIRLHVTIAQAGESLQIPRLGYHVTTTGVLQDPRVFAPQHSCG
jgi:hypothetical protein